MIIMQPMVTANDIFGFHLGYSFILIVDLLPEKSEIIRTFFDSRYETWTLRDIDTQLVYCTVRVDKQGFDTEHTGEVVEILKPDVE